MKIFNSRSLLTLLTASILVGSNAEVVELKSNFRDSNGYKNIAFGASLGGSTHITWVLSIGDELGKRGHNVSFVTTSDEVRFGRSYANIQTLDIGPAPAMHDSDSLRKLLDEKNVIKMMSTLVKILSTHYERDFVSFTNHFNDSNIDVVMCDQFMDACIDAAKNMNLPVIVTAAVDVSSETSASYINNGLHNLNEPTTEFQGFRERFVNKFYKPLEALYYFYPHLKDMSTRKKALGLEGKIEAPDAAWKDSMKLINNFHGFTSPRPVGPLAEYVGPIIPKQYKPLTSELKDYLDSHQRVAYVAFGQTAIPTVDDVTLILTSLLESIEAGHLDGFLWATVNSAEFFPNTVTTASGITYNSSDLFNHINTHARMIKWAPQTAILFHPSTAVFVSHGGLGSWYESMYTGTRMILFPFYGDQPANALIIKRSGLGDILNGEGSIQDAIDVFKKVVNDKDGKIQSNVRRMQALTQIHSDHGIIRGADVVEEVAYSHKNGKLPHRQSAKYRMSYIKANNLDLYATLTSLIASFLAVIFAAIRFIFFSSRKKNEVKIKRH